MSVAFGKYLYQRGIMPFYPMMLSAYAYFCHKTFDRSLAWLHHKIFQAFFKDFSKPFLLHHVEAFLDLYLDTLFYLPALEALQEWKTKNSRLAIFSSSPDFIVEPIAKRLEIDDWIGTCYLVDKEDRLCKIGSVVDGEYKAEYLKKLATRYQVPRERVTAYSDSWLDLPLLNLAGEKVGVNPEKVLYAHCKKQGWRVI